MYYYGTYSCGHEGRINIIGPGKDRQWKKEREFSSLCPECYKKQLQEKFEKENEISAQKTKEFEWPDLEGTEKQVKWATTLRLNAFEQMQEEIEDLDQAHVDDNGGIKIAAGGIEFLTNREEILDAIDFGITEYPEARFWINMRNKAFQTIMIFIKKYREFKKENAIPQEVKEEMENQEKLLTVKPEGACKSGIVVIEKSLEGNVLAKYVKDEDFRKIVKELNFAWNSSTWEKKINQFTGAAEDRAAEVGNILLNNGFTVRFYDIKVHDKAVSGAFEKEQKRWIKWNAEKKEFAIYWEKYNDTLYRAAKQLPGARWHGSAMYVSVEFYQEVIDFAETLGFSFSLCAKEAIVEYKKTESEFQITQVTKYMKNTSSDEELIRKKLTSAGVIEDLLDETE